VLNGWLTAAAYIKIPLLLHEGCWLMSSKTGLSLVPPCARGVMFKPVRGCHSRLDALGEAQGRGGFAAAEPPAMVKSSHRCGRADMIVRSAFKIVDTSPYVRDAVEAESRRGIT